MHSKTSEQIAAEMLRECALRALEHLQKPGADVSTVAKQMEQTSLLASRLVLTPPQR